MILTLWFKNIFFTGVVLAWLICHLCLIDALQGKHRVHLFTEKQLYRGRVLNCFLCNKIKCVLKSYHSFSDNDINDKK